MTRIIHQPEDKLFKQAMADIRVAKEFFQTQLPETLLAEVDLETLTLQKQSFIDDAYKASEADVLYAVKLKKNLKKIGYFYLLCENQSEIDTGMAFRLLAYSVRIMELHQKQYPKAVLPIVYPMVIYTGEKIWNAASDIFELFGDEEILARELFLKPYPLIDVRRMKDDELRQQQWWGLVKFALKYRRVRDFAEFLKTLLPWLSAIEVQEGANFARIVINYVVNGVEAANKTLLLDLSNQYLSPNLRGEVMTLAQQFEEQGRLQGMQQGKQQGIQQGIQQEKILLAKKLLAEGMAITKVAHLTDLSLAEAKALQSSGNE